MTFKYREDSVEVFGVIAKYFFLLDKNKEEEILSKEKITRVKYFTPDKEKYIYLPYAKITIENVDEFLDNKETE